MEKMMGCSKDHSKEIDLYDKPDSEKIDRIVAMKGQAEATIIDADTVGAEETKEKSGDDETNERSDLL